jgi:3-hydroxyacyl-[acyl-carrier-protein] dehydratase
MRWMWIDRVVELVPGQKLVAIKHISLAEEHLHDHFPASANQPALPIMPASLIIEGMAQTAGILVGHAEHFAEKVVLAKVSKAELTAEARPGDTLRYTAIIDKIDPMGASTKGTVELLSPIANTPPATIGTIDLMFSHLDQNMSGLEFPAHNFVFSESFRTLLRASGITIPAEH